MSEAGVESIAEKKKVSAWAIIGGALLAMYLPPVLAIFFVNRWTDVSRPLRTAAIVFSLLFPASIALWIALEKAPWRLLAYPLIGYAPILMHASFILCWQRHCGIKVSPLLKVCFWLAMILVTLGTIASLAAFALYLLHGRNGL